MTYFSISLSTVFLNLINWAPLLPTEIAADTNHSVVLARGLRGRERDIYIKKGEREEERRENNKEREIEKGGGEERERYI